MAAEQVDSGYDDGAVFGRSSGKIGFFGATTVVKQTGVAVPTDAATNITATTALRLALVNLGFITDV